MTCNTDGTTQGYHSRKAKLDDSMLHTNMEAFDKLPKVMRQALANSDHNWSATQALTELRKPKAKRRAQCASVSIFAAEIAKQDQRKHSRDAENGIVAP